MSYAKMLEHLKNFNSMYEEYFKKKESGYLMLNTRRYEYPYMEVPLSYIVYVKNCVNEVDLILRLYKLPLDTVRYVDIKEKYGRLDIHYSIPKLFEDLPREDQVLYDTLNTVVEAIIQKWQRTVYDLVRYGRL